MPAHRYWSIYTTKRVGTPDTGTVSLGEVELRATPGGPDLTSPGMTCFKSGGYGIPGLAIDNDTTANHSWDSYDQGCPVRWTVDLGAGNEQDVGEVAIWPRVGYATGESPKDFSVEYSDDNVAWTAKKAFTGVGGWQEGVPQTFLLASIAIASVTPSSGPIAGGTPVALAGMGLTGATEVTFGGVAATSVVVVSDAEITCTTPAHASGAVDVVVTVGADSATLPGGFTYPQSVAPTEPSVPLPPGYTAALLSSGSYGLYWIEIEGLPYAYGGTAQAAGFWESLPLAQRFEELRSYIPNAPQGVDARLDPLEGIAEPGELPFEVIDVDGFLTQAANVGREAADPDALWLTAEAAPGATTLQVGGNLAAWPASGIAYLGQSTVTYTGKGAGTLTGVTTGRYRSPDILHAVGEPVTQYPQHLRGRRAWFYLALSTTGVFSIADRVTRYAGVIDDYNLAADLTTWALTVRTPEKELGGGLTLFRNLRSGRLTTALPGPDGKYQLVDEGDPGVATDPATGAVELALERTDYSEATWFADAEWVYLRVEDEIVMGQWEASSGRLINLHRGLLGTSVVEHAYGSDWREGVPIIGHDATGTPEARHSKFTAGDRPEELVLQFLLGSGTYGVLPTSWNAGWDPSRVAILEFEGYRDQVHAGERLSAWVDEPVGWRELVVEHILKPWGLYLFHGADDKLHLGYLRQSPPATSVATIDASTVIGVPEWRSGSEMTIGEYRFGADLSVLEGLSGEPSTIEAHYFTDTRRLYGQKAGRIVHRSIFAHVATGPVDPLGSYRKGKRAADSRAAFLLAQYGKPPPVLKATALFSLFHVHPGNWVHVNLPAVPGLDGVGRGYVGPGLVRSRRPLDRNAAIEFEFLLFAGGLGGYGLQHPSGVVMELRSGSLGNPAQLLLWQSYGAADAPWTYEVGDAVIMVGVQFDSPSAVMHVTAVARDGVSMALVTVDSLAVAAPVGLRMIPADFDSQTASQRERGASMADAAETLGSGNARAYKFGGL